jgi:hypothetical protein
MIESKRQRGGVSRRALLKGLAAGSLFAVAGATGLLRLGSLTVPGVRRAWAQIPGGTLAPGAVTKYIRPLIKPPAMPLSAGSNKTKDKYKIAVRQFVQEILPPSHPMTTVWSYGSADSPSTFNYPAFTIEAAWNKTTQVQWRNELLDANGNYLPHLLPVDQTLHWANPPGGIAGRDMRGFDPAPYLGPVPIVTHVHGAHTNEDSDGYAEAWYLPNANNIPAGYATTGTFFDYFTNMVMAVAGHGCINYPKRPAGTTAW